MKTELRKARKYHHGDLRASLLQAARELLRREGVHGLSLRRAARRAKVSHNAPYHHFADKAAILAALAAEGFHEMAETIAAEQGSRAGEGAWGKIIGVGEGYLRFAFANPALVQMMFRAEITRPDLHPDLKAAEQRAFGLLVEAIEARAADRLLPEGRCSLAAAAFAWSTVHGLATLHIQNVLRKTPLGAFPLQEYRRKDAAAHCARHPRSRTCRCTRIRLSRDLSANASQASTPRRSTPSSSTPNRASAGRRVAVFPIPDAR